MIESNANTDEGVNHTIAKMWSHKDGMIVERRIPYGPGEYNPPNLTPAQWDEIHKLEVERMKGDVEHYFRSRIVKIASNNEPLLPVLDSMGVVVKRPPDKHDETLIIANDFVSDDECARLSDTMRASIEKPIRL